MSATMVLTSEGDSAGHGDHRMTTSLRWHAFNCPRCGNRVYFPMHDPPAAFVNCGTCQYAAPLSTVAVEVCESPPAAVQMLALVDEATHNAPLALPEYVMSGHPELVRLMTKHLWVLSRVYPVHDWLLEVLEDPKVIKCVRVYSAARKSRKPSSWAWTWALRQAILRPLLPLVLSPNVVVCANPVILTVLAVLVLCFLEHTSYLRAFRHEEALNACRTGAVAFAMVSIVVVLRVLTVEPGYVLPPDDWNTEQLPDDRSERGMRRAGRCPTCHVRRPPRAGHCKACGLCVERLDHHCHVIGQCIGRRNYGVFALYVFTIMAACACAVGWIASLVGLWPTNVDAPVWDSGRRGPLMAMARVGLLCCVAILVLAGLAFTVAMTFSVFWTLTTGRTTREAALDKRRSYVKQKRHELTSYYEGITQSAAERQAYMVSMAQLQDISDDELDDGRSCLGRWCGELSGRARPPSAFTTV